MRTLLQLVKAEIAAGYVHSVGPEVALLSMLGLEFEAEARRWGDEHGVKIVGSGFGARPAWGCV